MNTTQRDSAAAPSLTHSPQERLIRQGEVSSKVGLTRHGIYKRMREGSFPKNISIGGGRVAWLESEINEWIQEQINESRQNAS